MGKGKKKRHKHRIRSEETGLTVFIAGKTSRLERKA